MLDRQRPPRTERHLNHRLAFLAVVPPRQLGLGPRLQQAFLCLLIYDECDGQSSPSCHQIPFQSPPSGAGEGARPGAGHVTGSGQRGVSGLSGPAGGGWSPPCSSPPPPPTCPPGNAGRSQAGRVSGWVRTQRAAALESGLVPEQSACKCPQATKDVGLPSGHWGGRRAPRLGCSPAVQPTRGPGVSGAGVRGLYQPRIWNRRRNLATGTFPRNISSGPGRLLPSILEEVSLRDSTASTFPTPRPELGTPSPPRPPWNPRTAHGRAQPAGHPCAFIPPGRQHCTELSPFSQ